MTDYIESKVGNDGKILIEVENTKSNVGFGSAGTKLDDKTVDNAFNQALDTIRLAASSVLETLETLERKPDHIKIDFGIKIDPTIGAMLARSDSRDTQLRVSLGWKDTPPAEEKDEE